MARKKNATFVGCDESSVDLDAPTYRAILENAVGDTAKIYDMVTGANGETTTIRNRGETGRGAHIGMPLVMQTINADITYSGFSNGAGDGSGGETLIFLAPIYMVSANDNLYRAIVKADLGTADPSVTNKLYAVIYDDAMAEINEEVMTLDIYGNGLRQWYCNIDAGAASGRGFFGVKLAGPNTRDLLIHPNGGMKLSSVSLKPFRATNGAEAATKNLDNVIRVDTPSSTQALVFTDIDASHFGDLKPFDAYALSRVNQNQNAVYEYLTGWPAGSDASYTLFNADGGNAATEIGVVKHRFKQFARTLAASEGLPQMQIATWGLGAIKTNNALVIDKANNPIAGMLGWYGIYPRANGSKTNFIFFRQPIQLPDFFSNSNAYYKIRVIAHSDPGASGWSLSASTNGTAWGTAGNFAQLGTTKFWEAIIDMPSTANRDKDTTLFLRVSKTTAPAVPSDEIILLGVGISYEAP